MRINRLFPYILILSPLRSFLSPAYLSFSITLALIELPSSSLAGSHKFTQGNYDFVFTSIFYFSGQELEQTSAFCFSTGFFSEL